MSGRVKFVADAMLGSLARKLRIFGFDTLYFREGPDLDLERVADAEHRIILTSDLALLGHARRRGLIALEVTGRSEWSRIQTLANQAAAASISLAPGEPRCALCNGVLERLTRIQTEGSVPDSVSRRHRLYFHCAGCRKYYWRGGHWSRMRPLAALLKQQ